MRIGDSDITIPESDLSEEFLRASGPGGQNVNKVSSAVRLRFAARACRALPNAAAVRLMRLAGSRLTSDGEIVIEAGRFRDQARNRADARARLAALIEQALATPKRRIATRPGKAAKQRRLDGKKARAGTKKMRQRPIDT